MTDFYDINTRNEEKDIDELTEIDNEFDERLYSAKNMIDLAILAFYTNSYELIPTALEEAYYKLQRLVDDYCVEGK